MSFTEKPLFLGASHLTAGKGGIAAMARLTAKVLVGMHRDVRLLSLLDEQDGEIEGRSWTTTRGSRASFVTRCHLAGTSCNFFMYDSAGIARAHPRIAGLRRPYGLWMAGIEVWHGLQKDHAGALRGAALALVISNTTLQRFQELHGDLATAKVCWLATEDDDPPPVAPTFSSQPTVLALGTVDLSSLYKGQKELIECWADVAAAVPAARLVVAGGGNGVAHLRELAGRSPAARSIDVLGFVPQEHLPQLWQRSHVLALPSRKEGFGLVYVEAMRHRLPVVASVHDAGREVNVDGETGYNVDLDRPGELSERLIALLRSPDLAMRLGQNGHARWREHFRFSAFEERLRSILTPFMG